MPNTVASGLECAVDDVLVASTIGRGAWAILIGKAHVTGVVSHALEPGHPGPGDPVEGVVVTLDAGAGVRELTAVTDARGRFGFPEVAPGTYTVRRSAPPGWVPVGAEPERVAVQAPGVELDFRYRFDPELARVQAPYRGLGDLVVLPGREGPEPLGAPDEFDERRG